jgi:hypothetical protein
MLGAAHFNEWATITVLFVRLTPVLVLLDMWWRVYTGCWEENQ